MASIEIDGRTYEVEAGDNLLKACLELGIDLPYFCWHPALGSVGACRQCAVIQYQNPEDRRGRVVMSCMTPVAEGMRVSVQSPQARDFRANVIELLMSNHPHDCPVCEEGGECHLQDMTEMTGHTIRRFRLRKRSHRNQNLGPFINHEMNRCIACYRCVRYYQDYCGGHDLQVFAAHNHVYFGRHEDGALESEFSGNLVEVCPTGVFTDKTFSRRYARKWDLQSAPSVCPHCALGCNVSPAERHGVLRRIVNRYHGEINGYFLCDRGRFGYGFVNDASRIRQSRLRNQPPLGEKGVANHFSFVLRQSSGIIGIGSPRASLEANFALRELVGPGNFHLGFSSTEHGLMEMIWRILRGGPVRAASLRAVEQADAVFVLGEDVSNTAPRLALALRQAARNEAFAIAGRLKVPGWQDAAVRASAQAEWSPVYVASFAPTRLDDIAAGSFRGGPEDLASLGYAVANNISPASPREGHLDSVIGDLAVSIADALISAERPLIVSGTGCLSLSVIDAALQCAAALSARRSGRPTDVHFVVPECNSLGLAMMGGHGLAEAFSAVEQGRVESVVILENDLYRRAERSLVEAFLGKAKHVVAIDHVDHEIARRAELSLAASAFAESEGTWVSSEGRAQRYFAVYPAAPGAKESWRWLSAAAGKNWRSVDEVTRACAEAFPVLQAIKNAAPPSAFRIQGQKIPRQPHRYSGRTAAMANVQIHEPKQPVDGESALAYSMEGAQSDHPPALQPFSWAPGWNSNQSINKFQEEIGGSLRGGDPGTRLIETASETQDLEGLSSLTEQAQIRGRSGIAVEGKSGQQPERLRLVPLYHVFGSEELSMHSSTMAERAPPSYVALSPENADALGLERGDAAVVNCSGEEIRLLVQILPGLARGLAGIPWGLPGMPWFDAATAFFGPQDEAGVES